MFIGTSVVTPDEQHWKATWESDLWHFGVYRVKNESLPPDPWVVKLKKHLIIKTPSLLV